MKTQETVENNMCAITPWALQKLIALLLVDRGLDSYDVIQLKDLQNGKINTFHGIRFVVTEGVQDILVKAGRGINVPLKDQAKKTKQTEFKEGESVKVTPRRASDGVGLKRSVSNEELRNIIQEEIKGCVFGVCNALQEIALKDVLKSEKKRGGK